MWENRLEETPELEERCKRVTENLAVIRARIAQATAASGRRPEEIRLLAATKTVPPAVMNYAFSQGVNLFGENRVQEFLSKVDDLRLEGVETHFIGHLQQNKAKQIVGRVTTIQSVDSLRLAEEIGTLSMQKDLVTDILLEVNIGEESAKFGFNAGNLLENAKKVCEIPGIRLRGLMSIPPICEVKEDVRKYFTILRQLLIDMRRETSDNNDIDTLSMGMSEDYYEAVLEGSTMVRIGSALFGARARN